MKKFLIKVVLFSFFIYILAWGLDYTICRGLLKMDESRFQDYSAMLEGEMENEILIVGSSRAKHHFNPAVIDSLCNTSSYNLGIGGYPLNIQVLKYKLYKEHNPKPSLILLSLDLISLDYLGDIKHRHQSEQFFPLIYDKQMRKELRKVGYGFAELNIPLYRMFGYYVVIKNGLFEALGIKHYKDDTYKGFSPLSGGWDGKELRQQKPVRKEFPIEAEHEIDSFLTECMVDDVKVIVVNTPLYIGARSVYTNYDEADSLIHRMADKYGVKYLDYNVICDINMDSNNFLNTYHLNVESANAFTAILCDSILPVLR